MWRTVTREQLYEQVWSVPMWTLCEKYGLSDNGLRKICRRLNVPVPTRGYWAKVEAGNRSRRLKLPKDAKQIRSADDVVPMPMRTVADDTDEAWLAERKAYEQRSGQAIEGDEAETVAWRDRAAERDLQGGGEGGRGVASGRGAVPEVAGVAKATRHGAGSHHVDVVRTAGT